MFKIMQSCGIGILFVILCHGSMQIYCKIKFIYMYLQYAIYTDGLCAFGFAVYFMKQFLRFKYSIFVPT